MQADDGKDFKVDIAAALKSETIKNLIEDAGTDFPIPLPNVRSSILAKVIEHAKYHVLNPVPIEVSSEGKRTDDICEWDKEFCSKFDQPTLFELILAANYLDMKELLDLTCKTVANTIKGKTPEEIKKTFNITTDFTPEEMEQVKRENPWCEEQ